MSLAKGEMIINDASLAAAGGAGSSGLRTIAKNGRTSTSSGL